MSATPVTPAPNTPKPQVAVASPWMWWILIVILLIATIFSIPEKYEPTDYPTDYSKKILSRQDEYHLLKKGDKPIRIYFNGFICDYFGGGKKYYYKSQNGPVEIWGGENKCPTGKGNKNSIYADIWYYDEEITVVCKFRR